MTTIESTIAKQILLICQSPNGPADDDFDRCMASALKHHEHFVGVLIEASGASLTGRQRQEFKELTDEILAHKTLRIAGLSDSKALRMVAGLLGIWPGRRLEIKMFPSKDFNAAAEWLGVDTKDHSSLHNSMSMIRRRVA